MDKELLELLNNARASGANESQMQGIVDSYNQKKKNLATGGGNQTDVAEQPLSNLAVGSDGQLQKSVPATSPLPSPRSTDGTIIKKEGTAYIDVDGNKIIIKDGQEIGQPTTDEDRRLLPKETYEQFKASKFPKITEAFNLPFTKTPTVTTNDGVQFPVTETVNLVETENTPQSIQGLQSRITSKTVTPQDVEVLSKSSGKSVDAINAYIQGGQLVGGSVENIENVNKSKTKLETYIKDFNTIYGTEYDPNDILSSSQKTSDFLEIAKNKKAVTATDNINRPVSESTRMQAQQNAIPALLPTDISNEMISQVVSKTIDEDKVAGVPKDETIIKIAKRLNPKEFYKSVNAQIPTPSITGINTASSLGELFRNNTEEDELLNYQKGIAELSYNQSLKQNSINKISQGVLSNDANMIADGQHDLSQVDEDALYKYPLLVKKQIAEAVNNEIAKESGVVEGYDTQEGNRITRAFGSSTQKRLDVMKSLGILDDPRTKDIALGMAGNSTFFANNSIAGGAVSSFLEPFADLIKSGGDIVGIRGVKDIMADKIKDDLFQKDFSQNVEGELQLKKDVKVARTAINTTFNLAGMLAISTATEGIAGTLGASASLGQKLGAYTSFGLPSFDASLKDSKNFLDSEPAQYIYASINAIANAEGGRLLDLGKVTRIPGVSDDFAKIAKGFSENSITEDATRALLAEAKNKYIDFAVKYGKNVTKGAATMAYFTTANNIIKLGFGDPNTKAEDILPQAGHAFLDGVLGMSIMGGFGAAADMRNERNTTYKGTIYNMALNHDAAKDIFDIGLKNGEYDKAEYDNKIAILSTAVSAKQFLDKVQSEANVELTPDQKAVFVGNKTAENVLRNQAKNAILPKTKVNYEAQADKLKEQSEQILDGLKFTTTLEPLQNLYEAEKVYNTALENFNPDNPESVTALEIAKKNYDALNVKAEKDIPDTRLTEPIVGLDKQGVPENIVPDITVGEMINQVGTYKGEKGSFSQDGQTVIFKVEGKNKEYELGNVDEVSGVPISDFGITHEQSVVSIDEGGNIKVREDSYVNNFSDPLAAINRDADGNVVSVNLETEDGKKRTFRGNIAEDVAYQIHLKEITKDNETRERFENFINTDEAAQTEINNARVPEATTTGTVETNAPISREKIEPIVPEIKVEPITVTETKAEVLPTTESQHSTVKSEANKPLKDLGVKEGDFVEDKDGNKFQVKELYTTKLLPNQQRYRLIGEDGKIKEEALTPIYKKSEESKINNVTESKDEIKSIVDKYDNDENYVITDLVNDAEIIANKTGNKKISDAVKEYRKEQADDFELSGRGDMETANDKIEKIIREESKSETKPTVKSEALKDVSDRQDTPINIDDIGEGFVLHRGGKTGTSEGFNSLDKSRAEGYGGKEGGITSSVIKKDAKILKLVSGDTENYKDNEADINEFYKIIGESERQKGSEWADGEMPTDITTRLLNNKSAVDKLKKAGIDIVIGETIDGPDAFIVNENAVEKHTPKSETKPIQNEQVQKLEQERDEKIKEASRPEVKLDFIDESKLPKVKTDAIYKGEVIGQEMIADPKLIERQDNIKDRLNKLQEMINCLTA